VFEDHDFEQGLDDLLFFGCELCDSFELEPKIAVGAAPSAPKINTSALTCRATASRRITSSAGCEAAFDATGSAQIWTGHIWGGPEKLVRSEIWPRLFRILFDESIRSIDIARVLKYRPRDFY
jgi:hypothetical protein